MNQSENIKNIIPAMIEFRKNLVQPKATGYNPTTEQMYLTLSDIQRAVDKGCEGTGLLPVLETRTDDNTVYAKTVVYHETGEYLEFDDIVFPILVKDMQAFGSAITYTQKYSLKTAFGIAGEIDESENDGEGNKGERKTFANKSQIELITKRVNERGEALNLSDDDVWCEIAAELDISSNIGGLTEDDAGTVLNYFVKQKKQQDEALDFPWDEVEK